jgi:tetratricopeptide (TPR) repeat protein
MIIKKNIPPLAKIDLEPTISEIIKTIRTLITDETLDNLPKQLETLTDYVFANLSALNEDKQLRQKIADCLLLGGNKMLAMSPDKYSEHQFVAYAHFLNGDVRGLCNSMTAFIEGDSKKYEKPFTYNDFNAYIACVFGHLTDKEFQMFVGSMARVFEKCYPDTAVTYYLQSLNQKIDTEQAMQLLSATIAIDGEFLDALFQIASIYDANKNWRNAIVYYNKCVDLGDNGADLCFSLAVCYGKIKDYDNEIAAYKKCLESDPEYQFAMNNLGYAYHKTKDYENALSCYQKLIKSGRDGAYPYNNTFKTLKSLKRFDEAIAFFEENKEKLSKSFQADVDRLRATKAPTAQQQPLLDDVEDETESVVEQPSTARALMATGKSFLSESRLEDEIETQINRGIPFVNLSLKMYEDSNGHGKQYPIHGIGRIDLLTVNTESNDLYVIELKRGKGDDEIVGQVSRYMGWVRENLAKDGQNVYGIICTAQASDKLKYAVAANPNIKLYNYGILITPA